MLGTLLPITQPHPSAILVYANENIFIILAMIHLIDNLFPGPSRVNLMRVNQVPGKTANTTVLIGMWTRIEQPAL